MKTGQLAIVRKRVPQTCKRHPARKQSLATSGEGEIGGPDWYLVGWESSMSDLFLLHPIKFTNGGAWVFAVFVSLATPRVMDLRAMAFQKVGF